MLLLIYISGLEQTMIKIACTLNGSLYRTWIVKRRKDFKLYNFTIDLLSIILELYMVVAEVCNRFNITLTRTIWYAHYYTLWPLWSPLIAINYAFDASITCIRPRTCVIIYIFMARRESKRGFYLCYIYNVKHKTFHKKRLCMASKALNFYWLPLLDGFYPFPALKKWILN